MSYTPLYRAENGVIGGVCAGIAERLNIEANVLRVLLVLAFLCFGSGLLVYLAYWAVVPERGDALAQLPERQPDLWIRPEEDRKLGGVASFVAYRYGWDPSLVRFGMLGVALLSGGLGLAAYLVGMIAVPAGRLNPDASQYSF